MADAVVTRTKKITRDKLAKFLPNHEAIKAFEDLVHDVVTTLPDAIDSAATLDASQVLAMASFARPQLPAQPVNDAAGQILAGQIFGA
jgi:hypothetical protein